MRNFEYKIIKEQLISMSLKELNRQGAQGWELCVMAKDAIDNAGIMVFKRELSDE